VMTLMSWLGSLPNSMTCPISEGDRQLKANTTKGTILFICMQFDAVRLKTERRDRDVFWYPFQ